MAEEEIDQDNKIEINVKNETCVCITKFPYHKIFSLKMCRKISAKECPHVDLCEVAKCIMNKPDVPPKHF